VDKIILDPCIEDELWAIWLYIARDNPEAATRVIDAAYKSFKDLAANPRLGRVRKFREPRLRGVRSWHVGEFHNYLIFYRAESGVVRVLHVYHGAQNIEPLFED
jgi:toxin ParE1/3/4